MLRFLLLGGLALAAECGPTDLTLVKDGYFPDEIKNVGKKLTQEIKSKHFDISYESNYKVVTNFYAREQYVLTHCGSTPPTDDEVGPLPDESKAHATAFKGPFVRKFFTIPIKSFGDETGTTHGFGDVLGVNDRLSYVGSSIVSACGQKALGCDATMLGGHSTYSDATLATQIESADLWFNDKVWDAEPFFNDTKYPNAGQTAVAFTASWDPNMLHCAEWIKFFGAFFNLEDKAEEHFNKVSAKWNELSSKTSDKKVVFISNNFGSSYRVEADPLKVSLIEASGAKAIGEAEATAAGGAVVGAPCAPDEPSCNIDFDPNDATQAAAFRDLIATADIIIDEASNWAAAPPYTKYDASKFETNYGVDSALSAKTYRHDGIVKDNLWATDWYEGRYANPQELLEDLSSLVYGDTRTRVYLRRLDEDHTIMTEAQCDKDMPACVAGLEPTAIEAPCETYNTCVPVKPTPLDASASAAAALLLAAAAFA